MPHASCLTRHKESGEQAFGLDPGWASWLLEGRARAVSTDSTIQSLSRAGARGLRKCEMQVAGIRRIGDRAERIEVGELPKRES